MYIIKRQIKNDINKIYDTSIVQDFLYKYDEYGDIYVKGKHQAVCVLNSLINDMYGCSVVTTKAQILATVQIQYAKYYQSLKTLDVEMSLRGTADSKVQHRYMWKRANYLGHIAIYNDVYDKLCNTNDIAQYISYITNKVKGLIRWIIP